MSRLAKGFNIQVLVSTMHLIYKAEFSSRHPALTRWYMSNVIRRTCTALISPLFDKQGYHLTTALYYYNVSLSGGRFDRVPTDEELHLISPLHDLRRACASSKANGCFCPTVPSNRAVSFETISQLRSGLLFNQRLEFNRPCVLQLAEERIIPFNELCSSRNPQMGGICPIVAHKT